MVRWYYSQCSQHSTRLESEVRGRLSDTADDGAVVDIAAGRDRSSNRLTMTLRSLRFVTQ